MKSAFYCGKKEKAKRLLNEMIKESEMNARKEALLMMEMERERRKQHLLFVKAMESHKKLEDREKKKEELLAKKKALQEKKYQKRRLEVEINRELKKPVEDMTLKDSKPIPILDRIPGLKLPGQIFADTLMVFEFLRNFGETLGFDMESLPSLNTLQRALLCSDEGGSEELVSILHHLLVCAINDPGTPSNITTSTGQKLRDAPITNYNISEVLRLYFQSFSNLNREINEEERVELTIYYALERGRPFLSLSPGIKIKILAFLCNELTSNQAIIRKIEDTMENVSIHRKEKWTLECELRKYKAIKSKREKNERIFEKRDRGELEGVFEESAESEEDDVVMNINETEDDVGISNEELDKRLEKLGKGCSQATIKLNKAINGLRVACLGQDRYWRRYWLLPASGGIFVESMESGQPEEISSNGMECENESEESEDEKKECKEMEESEKKKARSSPKKEKEKINIETQDYEKNLDSSKNDLMELKSKIKPSEDSYPSDLTKSGSKSKNEAKCDMQTNEDFSWMSPLMTSVLASSMLLGNKDSNKQGNGIENPFSFPFGLYNMKGHKPWFSLSSKSPCTEKGSTHSISSTPQNESICRSKLEDLHSQVSQLGSLMNGIPQDLFMHAFLYPHLLGSFFQANKLAKNLSPEISGASTSTKTDKISDLFFDGISPASPNLKDDAALNINPSDFEVDPVLQSKLDEYKASQFKKAKKVPQEYQKGWWRITEHDKIKSLMESLNEKGIRERRLHKHLNKYLNYFSTKSKSNSTELLDFNDKSPVMSQELFGAPLPIDNNIWSREIALTHDIAVLEQIENLEEKIASSSMQIRGWRPAAKITTDEFFDFKLSKTYDDGDDTIGETEDHPNNPVKIGRERLLSAEAVIERRYLKPPLGFKSNSMIVSAGGGNDELADNAADENAPSGLVKWRDAVRECESGSQLAMLLHFLESCTAWDKSIMRASCQFCYNGENEAYLLLCDGCDRGYHTYCFKPKMETVPEGDWFCFECQNKNTIDKVCIVCGKKGKLLNCDTCPKVYHPNCLEPPVTKLPKGRWCCNWCSQKITNKKLKPHGRKNNTEEEKEIVTKSISVPQKRSCISGRKREQKDTYQDSPPNDVKRDRRKESREEREMAICEIILSEMETHDDCWPFLLPVNNFFKQFPTYKKVIKKPIDFVYIRNRLENGGYKSRGEFISDCRLIFDNCETFNEDESPVGQAGHTMRKYLEKRWKELTES